MPKKKKKVKKRLNIDAMNIPNWAKNTLKFFQFNTEEKKIFKKSFKYWFFVIGISVVLSVFLIASTNDIFAFVKDSSEKEIVISPTAEYKEVTKKLKEEGIIDIPWLFNLYITSNDNQDRIVGGTYTLSPSMGYRALVTEMKRASKGQIVKFTIPEGYEIRQIIDTLVNKGLGTKEKFQDVIDNYPFKHEFLKSLKLPKKNRLEGFLFPDTYEVYKNEGEVAIINRMLNNFKSRVIDEANLMERCKNVNMSFNDVVILASIIEREGKDRDELKYVSSVFHNRLNSRQYPKLQSCATIQYVLEERVDRISAKEIAIDSPYNTYKYKGLPPGPIANPGIESLIAAVEPAKSNYYFFVAKSDGTHIFSTTFAQHQKAISQAITQQGTGVVDDE